MDFNPRSRKGATANLHNLFLRHPHHYSQLYSSYSIKASLCLSYSNFFSQYHIYSGANPPVYFCALGIRTKYFLPLHTIM